MTALPLPKAFELEDVLVVQERKSLLRFLWGILTQLRRGCDSISIWITNKIGGDHSDPGQSHVAELGCGL